MRGFVQVSKRSTQLLRKARSAPIPSEFRNPKTWALKGKESTEAQLSNYSPARGWKASRGSYHAVQHPTHARAGPRHGRFSPRPPRGRSCWRRCSQLVRCATRKWGRGRARGDMRSLAQRTIGARQRQPRARPGLVAACEDRSADRFSRRKNTQELQTLGKLQLGQY